MRNEIVHTINKTPFVDSIKIAEMLEVTHKDLLRTIDKIVERQKNNVQCSTLKYPQIYKQSEFVNKMNRIYKCYELNEQAYMKLAMHLKGYEKAELVQDSIIEAFSMMKESLLNQQNASWLNSRKATKQIRRAETDIIKDFVAYATSQGSKSAKMYYMNITKMTNKALELLLQDKANGEPLRDLLSIQELGFIQVLENRAGQAIQYGMSENYPYKLIYKYAKEEVNKLADSLNFRGSIEK